MNPQVNKGKLDSSGPLRAPLELQLSIPNSPQKAKSLRFHLSLRNLSKNPVATYLDLSIPAVVSAELRTANGILIDLWQGPVFQLPLYRDGSKMLPPMKSMESNWEWPKLYKTIDESMGEVQLQFVYDTGLVASENYKPPIDQTTICSNPIVLRAKGDMVHVLGDYHKLYPRIHRDYLQSGLQFTKQYDAQAEKPSVPVLRAIAPDGTVRRTILTPYDLEGVVHLKNPQDALDFVRLFTARETRFLFRKTNFFEIYNKPLPGEEGHGMDMSLFLSRKFKMGAPTVKKTRAGYSVERCLLTYPDASTKKSRLYLSKENVSESGKYQQGVPRVFAESPFDEYLNISPPYY